MIQVYAHTGNEKLEVVAGFYPQSVICLQAPTSVEIARTAKATGISERLLRHPLDRSERPRLEKEDNAILTVFHLPVVAYANSQIPYETMPIGVIRTDKDLVVIANESLSMLGKAIERVDVSSYAENGYQQVIIQILSMIAQQYLTFINKITKQITDLQHQLKQSQRNKELFSLIQLNKSLVYFSTSLRAICSVCRQLEKGREFSFEPSELRVLQNIIVDFEQASAVATMRSESLSSLMDAYAAIVSNNLNTVLKVLTTMTIILSIPTMLGSIYSMNVALPYEEYWISTIFVASLMVILGSGLVYVFYKTKFLRS